jgi:hypothetical protein
MGHSGRGLGVEQRDEEQTVDEEAADKVDLGVVSAACTYNADMHGGKSLAYHDRFACPPLLLGHDQRMRNDEDRVANEGEGRGQRDPFKDALLRLGDIVVDGFFDKVAGWVGRGQRLASRAGGGGLGDISIRIRGGNAADGEGGQEEDEQENGIGILHDGDGRAQCCGVDPARVVSGEEEVELGVGVHHVGHGG